MVTNLDVHSMLCRPHTLIYTFRMVEALLVCSEMLVFTLRVIKSMSELQVEGPSFIGCLWQLVQYISSYFVIWSLCHASVITGCRTKPL
jgi:hypothetical protein